MAGFAQQDARRRDGWRRGEGRDGATEQGCTVCECQPTCVGVRCEEKTASAPAVVVASQGRLGSVPPRATGETFERSEESGRRKGKAEPQESRQKSRKAPGRGTKGRVKRNLRAVRVVRRQIEAVVLSSRTCDRRLEA